MLTKYKRTASWFAIGAFAVAGWVLGAAVTVRDIQKGRDYRRWNAPDQKSLDMHLTYKAFAKTHKIGLLFLGDSITERWFLNRDLFDATFGSYQPAIFGIGGDQTRDLLWRVRDGETDGAAPRVIVVLIGTNDITPSGDIDVDQTVGNIAAIANELKARHAAAKILVLGPFPRGREANEPARVSIGKLDAQLATLRIKNVSYLDIGKVFVDADGTISPRVMPDILALHLSPEGYSRWANAIAPTIKAMWQEK